MRMLTVLIAVSSLIAVPAFARAHDPVPPAPQIVPCHQAADGSVVCTPRHTATRPSSKLVRPASLKYERTIALSRGMQSVCTDMVRALPAHSAEYRAASTLSQGKSSYALMLAQAHLDLDRNLAYACSGKEMPMDDDGMDEESSALTPIHITSK